MPGPKFPSPSIGGRGKAGKPAGKVVAMAADLFGLEQEQPRHVDRKEAAALVEVLQTLRTHPTVT